MCCSAQLVLERPQRLTRMANSAMTLAATVWAVTFVFDGFVAPDIVRWDDA